MTRLLVVRHGQSEWNATGRWQGRADPPLTDEGRRQSKVAGGALGTFDAVVASPLLRAAETATIIAERLGIGPVLTDPDLVERDAGEWQGLTRSQIQEGWPGFLDDGRRPPGYEPGDAMLARVLSALERISERMGDGDVLVVSHGGVVYALEEACGEPWKRLPNLGARWFELSGGDLSAGPRVDLVPDGTFPDGL
jgi:probable phosphoglycerate mutase